MTDVERGYRIGETDLCMAIEGMRGYAKMLRALNTPYAAGMAQAQDETADRLEAILKEIIEKCNQPQVNSTVGGMKIASSISSTFKGEG